MTTLHNSGRTLPTYLILIAAFAAGLGLWLGSRYFGVDTAQPLQAITSFPAPRAVVDFQLTRSDGKPLARNDFKGHWNLVFFGFTNCPDICPNTLGVLKQVRAELAKAGAADKVQVHFISVDPQRDQPETLGRYSAFYDPGFIAATGSDEELTRLTRSLGLVYARTPAEGGNYSVDHSAAIVLIDPQAQQTGLIRPPLNPAAISADLLTLLGTRR